MRLDAVPHRRLPAARSVSEGLVRRLLAVLVVALAPLALASTASATHTFHELVSTGPSGGNGAFTPELKGVSDDGTHVFFQTSERLVAADSDSRIDVYERVGGQTTLASTGPNGANGVFDASFAGASADGSRVFFVTKESLTPADFDGATDVYERTGGQTTLVSVGQGGNGSLDAFFDGASEDGARVFFHTRDRLVAADTDFQLDVYQRSGGQTSLVSTGTTAGNGSSDAFFDGSSADGAQVFFETDESLVAGDTDARFDVYSRAGGTTALVSSGNGAFDAFYDGASRAGDHVFFTTAEAVAAGDTDGQFDIYERSSSGVSLVSVGPDGGNGAFDANFRDTSPDGSNVFFETDESLVAADSDSQTDVYESAGTTSLVSTGPSGGNGAFDALYGGTSADGTRVLFETDEALVPEDTDAQVDVYERSGGQTTLVSVGPTGGNSALDATHSSSSADGNRVFFTTSEQLVAGDADAQQDVYERFGATTTLISASPSGGNGAFDASVAGLSKDGLRALFVTQERLVTTDSDSSSDIYAASAALGYPRPAAGVNFRVPLAITYRACSAPNRSHSGGVPAPSCNPPLQTSDYLTVGTRDANGAEAQAAGSVRYTVRPGNPSTPADEADVALQLSFTDVRLKSDLSDYTGELTVEAALRLTDRSNGPGVDEPATVTDVPLSFASPCQGTPSGVGSTCAVSTSADAVTGGGVVEGKRSIWELGAVRVYDGGADGQVATAGNTLFARQGVFIP
jgi:hypothetical protein